MNVLVLLGCFALASCALGVLGLVRVSKDRRGLKCYERECLLDPLSLPHKSQQQQAHDNNASAVRSFAHKLISPLLLLLAPLVPRVEQDPSPSNHETTSADRIREFIRQAALQISGLSLLMANQHALPSAKPATVAMAEDKPTNNGAEHHHTSKIRKHEGTRAPQPTWADEDDADSFGDDEPRESDSTLRDSASGGGDDEEDDNDNEDDDEIFEDPCEEQEQDSEEVAAETDAQRALFDGLQFYTVLSQVGAATVHSVVQQAVRKTLESAATKRVEEQQQASISAIEQRYPDIMCLSAPSYHMQHTTRADLATALLAVTAAAAAMQQSQQHQQAQHCGTMERRLSIKRPDTLALAAEDGMEPMRRTPLASPTSSNQLEAGFLQAA